VLTADLLGEPYRVELPPGATPRRPDWLEPDLSDLDALTGAGLVDGAAALADALAEQAEAEGAEALLALAEGFNLRNRSLTGINLGWAARRLGVPWSDRLVRIVYPFPYQELVVREAREVGVDPLLLAALIRQESAFVPDIVSSAGAIGLMQVMPTTGRDLARSLGVENFTPETLESPEVNLHLGARFLVDQLERYGPDLPLVLSAYNAGPARANRWRTLPEAGDMLRLTERIPFSETRGYVKNVTRNQRLYGALYGELLDARGR
jgi:soluble lytic murein transglycosylase